MNPKGSQPLAPGRAAHPGLWIVSAAPTPKGSYLVGLAALDPPYDPRVPRRRGYTLLEVILAMALTIVILGLVTMAVHVNLGVAGKSRSQVEEAQLARALLQRVAEDLRNALPLVIEKAAPSESDESASSSSETASPTSGGIFGTAQELWIETSHRPRINHLAPVDGTQPTRLSDIRSISYSLGRPSTTSVGEQSDPTEGGLYRRDVDRAEFRLASEQGQVDALDQATETLAPEVVDVKFTYYDGTTASDTWDSAEQGKLPTAVRAAISIRRAAPQKPTDGEASAEQRPPAVYSMLIEVPSATTASQGEAGNGSTQ